MMPIVDVPNGGGVELDMPTNLSFVQLNSDGTFEDAMCGSADIFIEEDQVGKLSNAETTSYLRRTFGMIVGIIHRRSPNISVPSGGSRMYVLGS